MARWYCPKCDALVGDNYITRPTDGAICCPHCKTKCIDFDEIDRAVREYEIQGVSE